MTTLAQLSTNRTHALNAWLSGPDDRDPRFPRWDGDDSRPLRLEEAQFWPPKIKDAQQAEFARLDAIYENEKALL